MEISRLIHIGGWAYWTAFFSLYDHSFSRDNHLKFHQFLVCVRTGFISRIVALFLVPCLVGNPTTVMGSKDFVGAGLVPARNLGQAQGLPLQFSFTSQALAPVLAAGPRSSYRKVALRGAA